MSSAQRLDSLHLKFMDLTRLMPRSSAQRLDCRGANYHVVADWLEVCFLASLLGEQCLLLFCWILKILMMKVVMMTIVPFDKD